MRFLWGRIVWSLRHFSNCWMLLAIAGEVYVHNDMYRAWTVLLSFGPGLPRYVSGVVGSLKCITNTLCPPGAGPSRRSMYAKMYVFAGLGKNDTAGVSL